MRRQKYEVVKGDKYHRLTVIKEINNLKSGRYVLCRCDCGVIKEVRLDNLIKGHIKSCGCYKKEWDKTKNVTHGRSQTRLYQIWADMKQRCFNKNHKDYKNYGARGIKVCDEWMKFESFYKWSMEKGYKENLTIERIDVNKGYCSENCIWIKKEKQKYNTTKSNFITYKGRTKCLKAWWVELKEDIGVTYSTLNKRLKNGWSIDRAFTESKHKEFDRYA